MRAPVTPRRSCLSVPGSSPRMLQKAAGIAADEIVFDLEDGVIPAAKEPAREAVLTRLVDWRSASAAVRVNAARTPWCHGDLAALAGAAGSLGSIVLPKVESTGDLDFACRLLAGAEVAAGGRDRPLGIQALIETAAGLARVEEIAAAGEGRLQALILGYADLAASLGRSRAAAGDLRRGWLAAQDRVLTAARANGLQAIDGPFLGVAPDEPFLASARHARELGFDGKWAIHPAQVEALNKEFTPDADEAEHARAVLAALAQGETEAGIGAVALDGEMLDEALAAAARRVLARADGAAE